MSFPGTYGQPVARPRRRFATLGSAALALATAAGSLAFATTPAMAQAAPTTITIEKKHTLGADPCHLDRQDRVPVCQGRAQQEQLFGRLH